MNLTISERLEQVRADALQHGFPADDVERWLATALPCATLWSGGDGPVVGRFGGTPMVPRGTRVSGLPLVATVDCAALSAQAAGLPLPPDGQLLLFGYPEGDNDYSEGSALYVPAGVAVEEMPKDDEASEKDEEFLEVCQSYPQGDIHATIEVSLPSHTPEHLNPELIEYWNDKVPLWKKWGGVQIGGYPSAFDYKGDDGPLGVIARYAGEGEWVLLAEYLCDSDMRAGGAALYWGIRRDELAARRFDGVYAVTDWNP